MRKMFLIVWSLSIGLFSCSQGGAAKTESDRGRSLVETKKDTGKKTEESKELVQFTTTDCNQLMNRLFQSSSFESAFKKSELTVSVDGVKDSIVSIKVEDKEGNGLAAGWIELDLRQKRMTDITDDAEVPVILEYNKKMLDSLLTGCIFKDTE